MPKKTVSRPTCPAKWIGSWSSNARFGCWMATLKKNSGMAFGDAQRSILEMQTSKQGNLHQPHLFFWYSQGWTGEPQFFTSPVNVRKSCILPMVVATGCLEMRPKRSQEKHLTNRFHQLTLAENKNHWSHCHLVFVTTASMACWRVTLWMTGARVRWRLCGCLLDQVPSLWLEVARVQARLHSQQS